MAGRDRTLAIAAVVALVAGLLLVVAVPAGARPLSADAGARPLPAAGARPAQIVTAVNNGSTLTLDSGFGHYLYVGASSAGAVIRQTTFGHVQDLGRCGMRPRASESPIGPSHPPSDEGSFTTTGSVAVLAGVAVSGYSVHDIAVLRGGTGWCGYPPMSSISAGESFATKNVGGQVIMLVGANGIGALTAPTLTNFKRGRCGTLPGQGLVALRNVTVSMGPDTGGSVAVFSASLAPHSSCFLLVHGMSINEAGQGFSMFSNAYLLVPKETARPGIRTRSSTRE
jgi:hypothetical protein